MLDFNQLLNLAIKAMEKNVDPLNFLSRWRGKGRGIERWFQIELMTEISKSSNLEVDLVGTKGPDLKIENKFVELRCPTDYSVSWIVNGFKHRPEPHIILFLAMSSDKFLEKLRKLEKKGYGVSFHHVPSAPDWVIGYLTKS